MQITAKTWNRYKNKMSKISLVAADKMQAYVDQHGFDDRKALLDYAAALVDHYGQASGALACEFYDELAAAQGVAVQTAEMMELPNYGEIAKSINGAIKQSEKLIPSVVSRMIKKAGADTTLKNAERDGGEFAWIPSGDTCAYCLALAAKGWRHVSENTAGNGYAEHIHANCDCQYAVRLDKKSTVEGYDPEQYEKLFDNLQGETEAEKINTLRRLTSGKNALTLDQTEYILELENDPSILGERTSTEWKEYLEQLGFEVKPLGKGSLKGVAFEDGGGTNDHR